MIVAVIGFALLSIAEAFVIWALLNRVLAQAGQPPIELPRRDSEPAVPVEPQKPRRMFGIRVES